MDHELVTAVQQENDCLQKTSLRVEAEPQLPSWALIIEVSNQSAHVAAWIASSAAHRA